VEQARLHRETQKAAERAEEANRIKDEFLATVSHELRTPLNAIVGWAHMLDGEKVNDPEFVRRGLEVIRRNARSQTKIVEEILDVSRIISGKLRLEMASVDLTTVVREALEAVRPAAAARKIEIVLRSAGPCPAHGDAARLQQVAWNLLSNAVKFSPDTGNVEVSVAAKEDGITLIVSDQGEGITADLLPYVFERFRQGDSSTTRAHGGLGLGLAIVRHIVELHGGRVTAASEGKKKGATFAVTLPPASATTSPVANEARKRAVTPKSSAGILSGTRVLIVEDDADSRELIDEVLSRAGAEVASAASVADAFTAIDGADQFDVVVSDLGLPDEDGYTLVRRLRASTDERQRKLFVIALSAYTRPQDRTRALDAGFDVHLAKPVNPNELVLAVGRVANR
jgi:CheY-like chemotaxis protein/nitrogen-specific signal transduction histidine kinase